MSMVFTNSHSTPLFFASWSPSTASAYAATCIFLVILAALQRALHAGKHLFETSWLDRRLKRRTAVVSPEGEADMAWEGNEAKEDLLVTDYGTRAGGRSGTSVKGCKRHLGGVLQWWSLARASYGVVYLGVGYLL